MAWHTVEKKAKASLSSTLSGLGMASLAAVCKDRKLGPEAGAELSAIIRAYQAGADASQAGRGRRQPWGRTSGPTNSGNQQRVRERDDQYDPPSPWKSQPTLGGGAKVGSGPKPARACFLCGKEGHLAKDCRRRAPSKLGDFLERLDFPSGKVGGSQTKKQPTAWTCIRCETEHSNSDKLSCRKCYLRREEPSGSPAAPADASGAGEALPVASSPPAPPGPTAAAQSRLAAAIAVLKANNFPEPESLLQIVGLPAPESISVDSKPSITEGEREQALRRLPVLHKQIQQQQDNIEKFRLVIQEAQKELKSSEAAVAGLTADYNKLLSEVGTQDVDEDLCPAVEKDISPVLGSIRHVTQTLADFDHLDKEYLKYAAVTENPLTAAAWIAQEMRKHLTGLSDFCNAIGKEGGDYQLVKKRRTEDA